MLNVTALRVSFGKKELVNIGFSVEHSLALVGQSGSGKSLTLKALLAMLPNSMACELDCDSDFELKAGQTIAFVPQNPFRALSPFTEIK